MRVLFVTQHFPPEIEIGGTKVFELARVLLRHGHQVSVLTGFPHYPSGVVPRAYRHRLFRQEEVEGIRVTRTCVLAAPNSAGGVRMVNYLSFACSALPAIAALDPVDVVVATSPPLTVGIPGFVAARVRRVPLVFEVRDLMPEGAITLGMLRNGVIIYLSEALEKFMYRNAKKIVALSMGIQDGVTRQGIPPEKTVVIPNGADTELFRPLDGTSLRQELGLDDRFVVLYAGTFGRRHGFDAIIQAAIALKPERDILFLLLGDGAEKGRLLQARERYGLDNLIILPARPKGEVPHFIAASDACIATHRRLDLPWCIPAKIFEYMACGRPVILGVDGEAAQIVGGAQAGICVGSDNSEGIVEAVLRLRSDPELCRRYGENGRRLVLERYSREALARHYEQVLLEVCKAAS